MRSSKEGGKEEVRRERDRKRYGKGAGREPK